MFCHFRYHLEPFVQRLCHSILDKAICCSFPQCLEIDWNFLHINIKQLVIISSDCPGTELSSNLLHHFLVTDDKLFKGIDSFLPSSATFVNFNYCYLIGTCFVKVGSCGCVILWPIEHANCYVFFAFLKLFVSLLYVHLQIKRLY